MDDLTKVKGTTRWVIDTANEGASLVDQALVGSTAAFIALAFLVLTYFWVLAAMFGAMAAYRIAQHLLRRRGFDSLSEREQFDWIVDEKRRIWSDSTLPPDQREILSRTLDRKLGAIDVTAKPLELATGPTSPRLELPSESRKKP